MYVIDSLARGGAERSLASLAPQYRQLGVRLDVVVLVEHDGVEAAIRSAGGEIFSVAGATGRTARVRQLTALMRERSPDLVHTTLFESDVAGRVSARIARLPVVSSLVNEVYGPEHLSEPGIRRSRLASARALDATTTRLAIRMHAVSERVATIMARRLAYPASRIDVVPRGRDPAALGRRTAHRRSSARAGLGAVDGDIVVLTVGRHEAQKGLDKLVEVFALVRETLPRAHLYIAGRDGNTTGVLRATIARERLEPFVTLLGERSDIAELLCAADVFAFPSRPKACPDP